jgi:hypothetical protein
MQGQVLYRKGEAVRVQVRDLFDANGEFLVDWIHESCVELGTKPYDTWTIDVCNIPSPNSEGPLHETSV